MEMTKEEEEIAEHMHTEEEEVQIFRRTHLYGKVDDIENY